MWILEAHVSQVATQRRGEPGSPSHALKASRWAGNVGELPKRLGPISSLLLAGFTPLPYYGVYRSPFTPLGSPASAQPCAKRV